MMKRHTKYGCIAVLVGVLAFVVGPATLLAQVQLSHSARLRATVAAKKSNLSQMHKINNYRSLRRHQAVQRSMLPPPPSIHQSQPAPRRTIRPQTLIYKPTITHYPGLHKPPAAKLPWLYIRVCMRPGLRSELARAVPGKMAPYRVMANTRKPVPNARISIVYKLNGRTVASGKTNSNGIYSVQLKPGPFVIFISKKGFLPNETAIMLNETGLKKSITLRTNYHATDRVVPVPPVRRVNARLATQQMLDLPLASRFRHKPRATKDPDDLEGGICVISPNGGETLVPGRVHEIRWNNLDNVGLPFISIMRGDIVLRVYDSSDVIGTRTRAGWHWSWTVPRDLPAGSDYRIRLQAVATAANPAEPTYTVSDVSDAPFTIAGQGITIRGPMAGETLYVTRQKLLSWTSVGISSNVRILLFPEGSTSAAQVLMESVPHTGREQWRVGIGNGRSGDRPVAPGNYFIRAMSTSDHTIYHDTPVFAIALPDLRVTGPNPTESIRGDVPQTVSWMSRHMAGSIDIELWTGDVRLATVARDVRVGAFRDRSTWFPRPSWGGSLLETFRDVRVRLVSTSVPWFYVDGEARFVLTYE